MKTPTLETKRLILRPISLDDAPAVQKYFNHWDIIKYISNAPWPYPGDGALDYLLNTIMPELEYAQSCVWAITMKDRGDEAVGMINYRFEAGEQNDNRGFWLAVPFHGQGLMTEAVMAVNEFIFDRLGVNSFKTRNVKGNIGSHGIKLKTGGCIIGEVEEKMENGNTEIMELWEVTRESWEAARAKLSLRGEA